MAMVRDNSMGPSDAAQLQLFTMAKGQSDQLLCRDPA